MGAEGAVMCTGWCAFVVRQQTKAPASEKGAYFIFNLPSLLSHCRRKRQNLKNLKAALRRSKSKPRNDMRAEVFRGEVYGCWRFVLKCIQK